MSHKQHAQVHRFKDKVAIYVGTGETVYLHPKEAYALGETLKQYARDAEFIEFTASKLGTFHLDFDGGK